MRSALLSAVYLLALPAPAHASEVDCYGYRYGMRVRDLVTLDINDKKAPACNIPNNSRAWLQIKNWCNSDDFCKFRAHVKRRSGNTYTIDRIVGPVSAGN